MFATSLKGSEGAPLVGESKKDIAAVSWENDSCGSIQEGHKHESRVFQEFDSVA